MPLGLQFEWQTQASGFSSMLENKGRKRFFFEKKNQKTFICYGQHLIGPFDYLSIGRDGPEPAPPRSMASAISAMSARVSAKVAASSQPST